MQCKIITYLSLLLVLVVSVTYSQEVNDELLDYDDVSTINTAEDDEITTEEDILTTTYRPRPQFSTRHPHHKEPSHKQPPKHNNHSDPTEHQSNDSHHKQSHSHKMHSNEDLHISQDRSYKIQSHEESSKERLPDRETINESLADGSGDNDSEDHGSLGENQPWKSFFPRSVPDGKIN